MENLNAEQIIKALECCSSSDGVYACESGCPYWGGCYDTCPCTEDTNFIIKNALALIKELTEEKEAAIDDLKSCMYYAKPKSANTCNFCTHDCEVSKDGTRCKGKDDWIYCSPVWRGVVNSKSEGE